jgi:hypothetical protein
MAAFTALNGGDAKTSEGIGRSPTARHLGSEERSAIQAAGQETKSGETSVAQTEQGPSTNLERSHYQPPGYPEVEGTHKRKRSISTERPREVIGVHEQDQRAQAEPRAAYETPSRDRDYRHYGGDHPERGESWYVQQSSRDDRELHDSREATSGVHPQSEEQTGENIRRAASHADSVHDYPATSPDGDDSMLYGGSYSQDQSRDPVIQSDPKKRKRNFSNRTKTGKYISSSCQDFQVILMRY